MSNLNVFTGNNEYFVVTNGSHMLVVADVDAEKHAQSNDKEKVEAAVKELASKRFSEATLSTANLEVRVVSEEETEDAVPEDIKIPEAAIRAIAYGMWDDDDNGVDVNAEVADGWVSTWKRLSASDALEFMSADYRAPVPLVREVVDRRTADRQQFATLASQCMELDAQLTDDMFTADPAHAGTVAHIKALLQLMVQTAQQAPEEGSEPVARSVMRTWEVGDSADQELSAEQKQPWRVEVKVHSDRLYLDAWPAHEQHGDAERGLGVLFEIRKGRPALSVAPSPVSDPSLHVVSIGPDYIEVVPDTGRRAPTAASLAYDGTVATVYRNA